MDYREKVSAAFNTIKDKNGMMSFADLARVEVPKPLNGDTWGKWIFNAENRTIEYITPEHYYIDLDRCRSAAAVLDCLAQVSMKTWCSAEDAGNLLRALDDILHLQRTMCGGAA